MGSGLKNKAQVSMEYMVVLGISLAVVVSVLLVVNNMINSSTTKVSISSAYTAMEGIREAADFIYVTGHPSKIQKSVFVPTGVAEAEIDDRVVRFRVEVASPIDSSYTDIYAVTKGEMTGVICLGPCHEGNYKLIFESIDPQLGLEDVNITRAS
ncbi:MAG: hypothetical protein B6U97_01490 [Candidatus Altiarchaeales archaeon ex4484_96]|nr:MAG: hypothetical protein B6U97_01490 [Candidatus Altiarchaeales archaeon ex4484_96]